MKLVNYLRIKIMFIKFATSLINTDFVKGFFPMLDNTKNICLGAFIVDEEKMLAETFKDEKERDARLKQLHNIISEK